MSRSRSGAVNRRTFVKDAALAVAAAGGLTGGLGAISGLLAQPRPFRSGDRLSAVDGQTRPFNMICLGDSIMWGQGLQDPHKFTALVQSWLQSRLSGRPVNRFVYARSGATIGPDSEIPDVSRVEPWMNDPMLGEVPCSWPWVRQQVSVARADLARRQISDSSVDLVLLDGGANDIRIATLLNWSNTSDLIRQKSSEFCGTQMSGLLGLVRNSFPYAKILVTGYYPIVSEQSDFTFLRALLSLVLPFPIPSVLSDDVQRKLIALSAAWYQASNDDLARSVSTLNGNWTSSQPLATPPAAFASIPWGSDHSYASPSTRLWLVGLPEDEVYSDRASACNSAGQLWNQQQVNQGKNLFCLEAKSGHPNPSGAAAYAAACQAQLSRYLPQWNGLKVMRACVEMDPMPAVGVPTTLTVHATADGPAGLRTVLGTVRVAGQSFPTDTPVPLTLCRARRSIAVDDSGTRPTKEVGELTTSCAPLTVSAPGYVDVVITDYLKAQPLPRS